MTEEMVDIDPVISDEEPDNDNAIEDLPQIDGESKTPKSGAKKKKKKPVKKAKQDTVGNTAAAEVHILSHTFLIVNNEFCLKGCMRNIYSWYIYSWYICRSN